MTHMEDDSLQDHAKTISIPTDKEELGSDNSDQNSRLPCSEATKTFSTRLKQQSNGSKTAAMVGARSAVKQIPKTRLDAIPYAADCVRCALQQEERNQT